MVLEDQSRGCRSKHLCLKPLKPAALLASLKKRVEAGRSAWGQSLDFPSRKLAAEEHKLMKEADILAVEVDTPQLGCKSG